jgi:hypothetical protein
VWFKQTPFPLVALALCASASIPVGAQTSSFTIEAESMALSGYTIENDTRIKLTSTTGSAMKSCGCEAGTYDIQVFVQPESDGQPTLAVFKETQSTPLQTFTYPLSTAPTRVTIRNVALGANEPIRLVGIWNGGAIARVDKLVLTRVGDPTTTPGTGSAGTGTPFSGTPIALPGSFFAKDFDRGGEGVAYHDLTPENTGGQYRPKEGIDIVASTDTAGGGHAINSFQTGEWLSYTVNVAAEKNYDLAVHASNNRTTPASFHIEVDGVNVTGSVTVPRTGSWSAFRWVDKQGIKLSAGKHVIKVVSDQQYFNMSAVSVLESGTQAPGNGGGTSAAGGATTTKPASLLFWSGFEDGVSLGAPRNCYSAGCWQDLLGTDSTSGFSWPPRIGGGGGQFQVRSGTGSAPSDKTISDYIVNEIQTVDGPKGTPTRVLHSQLKQTGCTGTASQGSTSCSAQDPYLLQPTREPGDMYISFWRKIDPTLAQKLKNGWHVVFEWKSTGDYRVIAQIVNYGGTPYWEIRADNVASGDLAYQEFWRVRQKTVPVPLGEWFKFEVFWHRSKGSDGRVWVAVNGQTLVDKFGSNIGVKGNPINRIFLTQLYSAASYPLEQWTDDVQIWSGFPIAEPGDPWYDGVYAPH